MKLPALMVFITLGWISILTRSYVVLSLKRWILERERPIKRLLESVLQPSTQYSKVTMSFLLFLSKPFGRGVFQCISKWFLLVCDLSQWCQTCTEESKAAGLVFAACCQSPGLTCLCWPAVIFWQVTRLPFIQLSLVLSKAPPPRLYVRKKQNLLVYLKEAAAGRKNGTPYSRCHGADYWWDWGQLVELVMSGVCFQLSRGCCFDARIWGDHTRIGGL